MTANILNSELANIIQESKRKNAELRTAAEQSLQDLKAIAVTSETQLAADLRRRPRFISPFLLACKSRNAKATLSAVSCLQRLVVNNGIANDRLKDVLEAFQESIPIGLDVQLRVLQALPSFLQTYGDALEGDLQASVLQTCITLQQIKNVAVSNTASATLQQSVSSLFEKVEAEDSNKGKTPVVDHVSVDAGSVPVRPAAFDAYRMLKDICLMTQGEAPQYIRKAALSQTFGLELIETVLLNHADLLNAHEEFADLLLKFVMPLVNRFLSERLGFPLTVRAVRILCILLREHLDTVDSEVEIALALLNHNLESESSQPWRRALCMEAFRVIYSSADLVVDVYSAFDQRPDRGNVLQDNLSIFVRMASEKPALIGLGHQSSIPSAPAAARSASQEQAVAEAEAAAGMFGSDFGVSESNVPGINTQWSTMKVSCLDHLDKADGPPIPETYIYSLVLTCINGLSDSLAKVVLPLSMHRSQRKGRSPGPGTEKESENDRPATSQGDAPSEPATLRRQQSRAIPANPLDLSERSGYASVVSVAALINSCWPAVLATASTFFNAALDADFYRSLVRSFQKFTQVAGILRLATPRDALLTTLAKTAVPPSLLSDTMTATPSSPVGGSFRSFQGFLSPTADGTQPGHATPTSSTKFRQPSVDASSPTLTQRNLMCLRALIHLAIALGPILDQAWTIVLETVQKADVLMVLSGTVAMAREYRSTTQGAGETSSGQPTLASEMAAVEGAISKLMQTTNDYPTDSFKVLLTALCDLLASSHPPAPTMVPPLSPTSSQRRVPSVSGITSTSVLLPQYSHFAVAKIGDLAKTNLRRLACGDGDSGWDLITETLKNTTSNTHNDTTARQMAADVVANLAAEASISTAAENEDLREIVQQRSFNALKAIVEPLHEAYRASLNDADLDIHQAALGALRAILEHCGDALIAGWDVIFDVIDSVFSRKHVSSNGNSVNGNVGLASNASPLSVKLARTAFASVQLMCSDFLSTISVGSYPVLIDILTRFCGQTLDMNISLSVVTVFWNVSDHLSKEIETFDLPDEAAQSTSTLESEEVRQYATAGSVTATWLVLQQKLALLAHDSRADVRNGSVHILFRTLENSGDQVSPTVWGCILHTIFFPIIRVDSERQTRLREQESSVEASERTAMNQTSNLILENAAKTFVLFVDQLTALPQFEEIWHAFLELLAVYIDCESYELSEDVFIALARILASAQDLSKIKPHAVNEVASLWARDIPKADELPENTSTTRDRALLAYLKTLKQVHRLWKDNISPKQLSVVIQRLQECVYASKMTPYTNDVSKETDLQAEILKCFDMLQVHLNEVPAGLTEALSEFVRLPYKGQSEAAPLSGLTFVAFAKTAMSMLQAAVTRLALNPKIWKTGGLASSLEALAISIEKKYLWQTQGSDPPLWRKAVTSSVVILADILPACRDVDLTAEEVEVIWLLIIRIGSAIHCAEYTAQPLDEALIPDETFDLASAASFRALVTPYLDEPFVPPQVRLAYVHTLFRASTLHPSRHDDDGYFAAPAPKETFTSPALAALPSIRLGRTHDPPFNPRIRMSYATLDELFGLVAAGIASDAGPLARAALPFVVLRCAVPLKRYIADQPLRGRMPTPTSQRLELLYLMDRIQALECAPGAEEGLTVASGGGNAAAGPKAHMKHLAPLVNRALEHTGRDAELGRAMLRVIGAAFKSGIR